MPSDTPPAPNTPRTRRNKTANVAAPRKAALPLAFENVAVRNVAAVKTEDDKTFFYEATRRLCSSLQPETAIAAFYDYVTEFVPLTGFILASTPQPFLERVIVAHASSAGVICPFERVVLPPNMLRLGEKLDINNPFRHREHMLTEDSDFSRFLTGPQTSVQMGRPAFFLRMVREEAIVGSVVFGGQGMFNERQLHLLRGLEGPLCLALSNMLQHRELVESRETALRDNRRLKKELADRARVDVVGVVGADRGLARVMEKVRQVAPVDVPVLLTGETGTGKDVIARSLHSLSDRRERPFVAVNCGALPASLIDSALFGHARGAFTGAADAHKGYFERAEGGTLFLDEIGELPPEAQARLLRVLESGEVEKVGGSSPLRVNIRLLAATNRDLGDMVRHGSFRSDLLYRLNVVCIHIPPLRQRKEDIPLLVRSMLRQSAASFSMEVPPLAPGEMERLLAYDWPGNVRELRNVLDEALVCCAGGPLHFRDSRLPDLVPFVSVATSETPYAAKAETPSLPPSEMRLIATPETPPAIAPAGSPLLTKTDVPVARQEKLTAGAGVMTNGTGTVTAPPRPTYDEVSKTYFLQLLEDSRWRVAGERGAAARAGLKPGTFRFRCRKLGISLSPH